MHSRIVASDAAPSTATTSAPALAAISTSTRPASMIFMSATMVASGNSERSARTASRPSLLIRGVPASRRRTPPSHASLAARRACDRLAKSSASCSCTGSAISIPPRATTCSRTVALKHSHQLYPHAPSNPSTPDDPAHEASSSPQSKPCSRALSNSSPCQPPHGAQNGVVVIPSPHPQTSASVPIRS